MPHDRSILDRFDLIVSQHADRCAVEGDKIRLSYRELDDASRGLAEVLTNVGVVPGGYVPLLVKRSPEFVVGVLAVLRCGAAYAPIDPQSPALRRTAMIEALSSPVCLADGSVEPPEGVRSIDPRAFLSGSGIAPDLGAKPNISRGDPAYVIYTSGTTGTPKGVVVPQGGVLRLVVDADYAHFGPDQRWALASAVAFDASTLELWGALLNGGCCVVQERALPSLEQLGRFLSERSITDAWLTTSLFNALIEEHTGHMRGLCQVLIGGERVSPSHIRRFIKACPDVRLINGYGPTENTTFSLCHTITPADAEEADIPIGTPIHGSTARIVDPSAGPDEPETELATGELLVGGEGLALGYLGRDDLTAQRFGTDQTGTRWYRTGDTVVRRNDGLIVYTGRLDRQVKVRGYRVELDDIEAILGRCPGVTGCAVILDGQTSTSQRIVAAYQGDPSLSTDGVREYMSRYLPPAHLPQRFTKVDSLPRGMAGKIDRGQVATLLAAMSETDNASEEDAIAEDSACAVKVAELVRARLGLDQHVILNSKTDMSSIGGYSLLAMRLSADIEGEFGVWIEPVEILGLKRIGAIAERIEDLLDRAETDERDTVEMGHPIDEDTIGATRQRIFLEHERDPTGRAMLVHQGWIIDSIEQPDGLRTVWSGIIARHDALRSSYAVDEDGLRLVRLDHEKERWFYDEGLIGFDADQDNPTVPQHIAERLGVTIQAGQMPLRVHFWRREEGGCFLGVVYHHAAVDEWSLDLIAEEMMVALSGSGHPSTETFYREFAACEVAWRDEESAQRLASRVCATQSGEFALPESGPQKCVMLEVTGKGSEPQELATALDAISVRHQVTPAAAGLAVFGDLLKDRFGEPGRWVLTPVSKRITTALQRLVGCCLDMRLIDTGGNKNESARYSSVGLQLREAQGRSTLALDTLRESVRQLRPDALDHLTRFGFTYREFTGAEIHRNGLTVRRVPLPQLAARFGLALHVERHADGVRLWFEASRDFFSDAMLAELATEFVDRLRGSKGSFSHRLIFSEPSPVGPPKSRSESDASAGVSEKSRGLLRGMWKELLGTDPEPASRFDEDGGDSLVAMKLSSMIHARMGLKLHIGEFLRHKTFESLVRWVRDDPEEPYSDFRRRAESDPGELVLAIPGASGRAVDLHALWEGCLERGMPYGRMLGFDLVTLVRSLPLDEELPDRTVQRISEIGLKERGDAAITLIGYSLGGLLAIGVAARLASAGVPISGLILLDAYAPAYLSHTPTYYAARLNAEMRRGVRRGSNSAARTEIPNQLKRDPADAALWKSVLNIYSTWKLPRVDVPCLLVRSASGAGRVRPVRHASTNGLRPYLRSEIRTDTIDVDHLAMLTGGVEEVCRSITSNTVHEGGRHPR